jgi:hypothetical protein
MNIFTLTDSELRTAYTLAMQDRGDAFQLHGPDGEEYLKHVRTSTALEAEIGRRAGGTFGSDRFKAFLAGITDLTARVTHKLDEIEEGNRDA